MSNEQPRSVRGIMLAKGSSRRLPRKNMHDFGGSPMFLRNLQKMIDLGLEPILDSDDDEILRLAQDAGATPHARDSALHGPDVPTLPIVKAAFEGLGIASPTAAVIVQANSPNLRMATLIQATDIIANTSVDEVMSAFPDRTHNGSVWAVSHERLFDYGDPYQHRPDVLLVDDSVDIHDAADLQRALDVDAAATQAANPFFDVRAPDPSISQAYESS